jgi:hypothetical protein
VVSLSPSIPTTVTSASNPSFWIKSSADDPDVALPPTNTFHVGLWFDNPNDAVACHFDPTKTTPFNGEHQAGPLAMVSLPDAKTGLGPLCTDPNTSTTPASCNP